MSELIDKKALIDELLQLPGVGSNSNAMDIIYRFQSPKIELNDNQQIVLDWLKWDFNKNKVKAMECIYRVVYGENILDMVLLAYIALDNKHQVQVLEVFAKWVQEQEED